MKKFNSMRVAFVLSLIMPTAALLSGCGSAANVVAQEQHVNVDSTVASVGDFSLIGHYIGTAVPSMQVNVYTKAGAVVESVNVKTGDTVKEGDILFTLDDDVQSLSVDRANIGYDQTRASYDQALTQAENGVVSAQDRYDQLLIAYEQALINADNTIEKARIGYESSIASRDQALGSTLDSMLAGYESSVNSAEGAVSAAKAAVSALTVIAQIESDYEGLRSGAPTELGSLSLAEANAIKGSLDPLLAGEIEALYTMATNADIYDIGGTAGYYKQQLAEAESAYDSAQNALRSAERVYEINEDDKADELEELQDLSVENAKLSYDQAIEAKDLLIVNYEEQLETALKSIETSAETVDLTGSIYGAQLDSAQNSIESAILGLENFEAIAPVSGVVDSLAVEERGFINANQVALTVSDYSTMDVTFYVSEAVKNEITVGQAMSITYNGNEYAGEIGTISNSLDARSALFKVEATIQTPSEDIASGVSVNIMLATNSAEDVLVIPYKALHFSGNESYVYVIRDGRAARADVTIGLFDDENVVILEGLSEGDEVITTWSPQLRNGTLVATSAEQVPSEGEAAQ